MYDMICVIWYVRYAMIQQLWKTSFASAAILIHAFSSSSSKFRPACSGWWTLKKKKRHGLSRLRFEDTENFFFGPHGLWTKRKNYFFWDSSLFCICLAPLVSASQVATILIEFAHTETQHFSKSSESSFWHRYCWASVLELHSNRYTATTIFRCQK